MLYLREMFEELPEAQKTEVFSACKKALPIITP
jgi:hypothetical protein